MTSFANIHADAAGRFASVRTPGESMQALAELTAPFGYSRFHYTQAYLNDDGVVEGLARVPRMGRDYEESWAADAHRMADPLVDHCLQMDRPKFWSELKGDYHAPGMTDAHRLKIDSIVAYGLSAGFTKRLQSHRMGRGRFYSGVSLVQDVEASAKDHDRAFNELRPHLSILLDHFSCSMNMSQTAQAYYEVTDREFEVLKLLSDGLQVQQISDRLSLADRTTAHHLASLRRKLGAHSNAQAVALAMKIHMI